MKSSPPPFSGLPLSVSRRPGGFTLVELIVVIVILGILAATALPKFVDLSSSARTASIQSLGGSVSSAMGMVRSLTAVRGVGAARSAYDSSVGITWVTLPDGASVRLWNGFPDRWCDGIGITQMGFVVPSGGCYLSNAAVQHGEYTFYGYGNGQIPGGDAGWRIESAPTPQMCSVQYTYNGSGEPVVTVNTSGC